MEFFILLYSLGLYAAAFSHGRYVESKKRTEISVKQDFCGPDRITQKQVSKMARDVAKRAGLTDG